MDVESFNSRIDQAIQALSINHASSLAAAISTYYRAGSEDSRKEQGKKKSNLSPLQEAAMQKLTAEHFGYMTGFDKGVGEAIKKRAVEILAQEGGYKEIKNEVKKYVAGVFEGKENVTINHVGQVKKVLNVDKNGKLFEVEKVIEREYVTNVDAYSDMLSRTATHKAFEQGRASEFQRIGIKKWRFVGSNDERTRPWHIALLGEVFEYGTEQSDYALQLLGEPHCRHRAIPYHDDPELDTPREFYQSQKDSAGLFWDDDKDAWAIRE